MAVHKKYNALGRGLDALISTEAVRTQGSSTINEIPIDQIQPNAEQPRTLFDEEALHDLAKSIKEIGIIQPITLRQIAENKDENVMEMALVENIQREDLNAIEIALAYEHLLENTGMTQEQVSERVGKSRTAITNYLRLLKLPAEVQMALQNKQIDMGHARALLSLEDPKLQIQAKNQLPEDYTRMKNDLSGYFQAKVQLSCTAKGKGKISIPFNDQADLERIMQLFARMKDNNLPEE